MKTYTNVLITNRKGEPITLTTLGAITPIDKGAAVSLRRALLSLLECMEVVAVTARPDGILAPDLDRRELKRLDAIAEALETKCDDDDEVIEFEDAEAEALRKWLDKYGVLAFRTNAHRVSAAFEVRTPALDTKRVVDLIPNPDLHDDSGDDDRREPVISALNDAAKNGDNDDPAPTDG